LPLLLSYDFLFCVQAIKVVMLAQEEARRLGHNFVGTEQILLGLIGESTGIAAKVLKSMGVNLKDARVEVEKIIGRGSGFVAVEIPFTPRAKRVLELSLEEARQLGKLRFTILIVMFAFLVISAHCTWPRFDCIYHTAAGCCCCTLLTLPHSPLPPLLPLRRPQLHRHRAHPAGPAA
jgi:hypothetical protein